MKLSERVDKGIFLLGYDLKTGKPGLRVKIFVLVLTIAMTNACCLLIFKWDVLDNRIIGIKLLGFYSFFLLYLINLTLDWDNFLYILKVVKEGSTRFLYDFKDFPVEEKDNIIQANENDMTKKSNIMFYSLFLYFVLENLTPLLATIYVVIIKKLNNEGYNNEDLVLVFPFYYPGNLKNNRYAYVFAYVQQFMFNYYVVCYAYVCCVTVFCAMNTAAYHLQLLTLALQRVDQVIKGNEKIQINPDEVSDYSEEEILTLKKYIKFIIDRHINMYRLIQKVTKGARLLALILCVPARLYLGTSIYYIVETDKIGSKVAEIIAASITLNIIYIFDKYGEMISTEDNNIRQALYECSWVDKPIWYKKLVLTMMARTTKRAEVKPYGFFYANLENFTLTINAVYSYYNLLNTMKHK